MPQPRDCRADQPGSDHAEASAAAVIDPDAVADEPAVPQRQSPAITLAIFASTIADSRHCAERKWHASQVIRDVTCPEVKASVLSPANVLQPK